MLRALSGPPSGHAWFVGLQLDNREVMRRRERQTKRQTTIALRFAGSDGLRTRGSDVDVFLKECKTALTRIQPILPPRPDDPNWERAMAEESAQAMTKTSL